MEARGIRVAGKKPSIDEIACRMSELLPPDGTPVLNRIMRVMLSRDLETTIEPERLFEARDLLLKQGRIGRLRGQGGQLFLIPTDANIETRSAENVSDTWTEAKLMTPLRKYLEGAFTKELDLPKGSLCIVQDTSTKGSAKRGRWARPDFILVSATRLSLLPGAQVELHSFELKTEIGVSNLAVYEALAQTRFTHFGHLVWHLPKESRFEALLIEIEEQCDEHGVGLIRMFDPHAPDECEILLDPIRKNTSPLRVEDFLETRLVPTDRHKLSRLVNGDRA